MRDQKRISPYNIETISIRHVMRIKKNIGYGISGWFDTKLTSWQGNLGLSTEFKGWRFERCQHHGNCIADSNENY